MTPDEITRAAILLARRKELADEEKLCLEAKGTNVKLQGLGGISLAIEVSQPGYLNFLRQEIDSIEHELRSLGVEE